MQYINRHHALNASYSHLHQSYIETVFQKVVKMTSASSIATEKQTVVVASDPATDKLTVNFIRPESPKRGLFQWFHPDDGPAERKLVTKLDLSILTFACFGFWVCALIFQMVYTSLISERPCISTEAYSGMHTLAA